MLDIARQFVSQAESPARFFKNDRGRLETTIHGVVIEVATEVLVSTGSAYLANVRVNVINRLLDSGDFLCFFVRDFAFEFFF